MRNLNCSGQSDFIKDIVGNIIGGQVTGDTAKQLSERFGKIMQNRESLSINCNDTFTSKLKQLEGAMPPSKISGLSSGEFVGMVADDPDCKIDLKPFHCASENNHAALTMENDGYKSMPEIRQIDHAIVQVNYMQIRQDVQDIVQAEMQRILSDLGLQHSVIKK